MAEVDYLDLILNQNLPELDLAAIKKQAIAQAAKAPKPSPAPVLSAMPSGEMAQVQEESVVSADPLDRDVYIQEKPTDPRELSQNRESYNMLERKLRERIGQQEQLVGRQEGARQPYIDKLNQMVDQYMQPAPRFKSQYEDIVKRISEESVRDREEMPQESFLEKAIYALGPGVLATLGGEAGGLAAPAAQRGAYALREQEQKRVLDAYKTRQNEGSKRQVALKLLMDSEQEAFNKQQETQEKRMGEAQKILSSLSSDESKRLDQAIADRMKLLQDDVQSQRISIKEYQDNVGQLSQLKNQLDIAKIQAEAGITREKIQGKTALDVIKAKPKPLPKGGGSGFGGQPIPGLIYDNKTPIDKTELKKLREAYSDYKTLDSTLGRVSSKLKEIAKLPSGQARLKLLSPSFQKELKNDLRQAQLAYKGEAFAKLGVLTGPDLAILEDVIENPSSISNVALGPQGVIDRISNLQKNMRSGVDNRLGVSGFAIGEGQVQGQPSQKQDSNVAKYAKDNNLSYDKALSILTKRGYKPQ